MRRQWARARAQLRVDSICSLWAYALSHFSMRCAEAGIQVPPFFYLYPLPMDVLRICAWHTQEGLRLAPLYHEEPLQGDLDPLLVQTQPHIRNPERKRAAPSAPYHEEPLQGDLDPLLVQTQSHIRNPERRPFYTWLDNTNNVESIHLAFSQRFGYNLSDVLSR